ncbi:hypothetical protein [Chelatococcus reniformis]|uniref:Uncharacterized protein n=1 Tax=Chelatococcus reniformis TaxID=1494448 RepID=A0A916UR94_9HYPH|nr:hypothetical protein [Chelatococcus reniformis]GGC84421.1 hypothetical protein GCM10010994_47920 [Chelatococcus reniformis]
MATTFVITAAVLLAALLAAVVALDPYDTGRLALIEKGGIPDTGPRIANASRGRDPAFNAALIGNSRVQMVEPSRLDAATGLRFVTLMVPAIRPEEQLVLLRWFLRNHPRPAALVIGLDEWWCLASIKADKPFPFWLYAETSLGYVRGLLRFEALEQASRRLAYLGGRGARARPDGFWDYEQDYISVGATEPELHRRRLSAPPPSESANPANRFPGLEALDEALHGVPPTTAVVLTWSPVHHSYRPVPGSPADGTWRACRESAVRVADSRPRTAVLDWSTDRPESWDDDNFFDRSHYRRALGQRFADAIGRRVAALMQASP